MELLADAVEVVKEMTAVTKELVEFVIALGLLAIAALQVWSRVDASRVKKQLTAVVSNVAAATEKIDTAATNAKEAKAVMIATVTRQDAKLESVAAGMQEVKAATDGLTSKLVVAEKAVSFNEGVKSVVGSSDMAEVVKAVEKVPEVTADLVIDKIKPDLVK